MRTFRFINFCQSLLRDVSAKVFKSPVNKCVVIFFLLIQILNTPVCAQVSQPWFKHYTTRDGLSQGFIYHMMKDSRGFLWFSTSDGVNRFDGYNFKVFKPIYNDSNSIAGTRINSVVEDRSGMLWMGSNEALNCYNFKTNTFKHFYIPESLNQKLKGYYDPFYIDDKDQLWLIYGNYSLASMSLITGKITTYPFANSAMEGFVTVNYPEKKLYRHLSKIYTNGNSGLHIIDMDKRKVDFYFSSNSKNEFGSSTRITGVLEDKNHILWIAAMTGLMSFNPLTKETRLFNEYNGKKITSLMGIAMDKDGYLWCTNEGNGLSIFDTKAKKFVKNYEKNASDPGSLGRNFTATIFIDNSDNIWTCVNPDGVDMVNPFHQQLNHVKIILPQDENYSSSIGPLCEIDSNHIITTSNIEDLIVYDKIKGISKKIELPGGLGKSHNVTVFMDSVRRIWIASDSGLYLSDVRLKSFRLIAKQNFEHGTFFEFKQKIFIGAFSALYSISANGKTYQVDTLHLLDNKTTSFIGKSPGGLLCVTSYDNYFYLIDVKSNNYVVTKKINFNFRVTSVFFKSDDTLWMGTSAGLARFVISKNNLKVFTEKDGLANNFVYCVFKGNDGKLWMCTNRGISRFDIINERFTNYGLSDGVQAFEFNSRAYYQSQSGTIYFGGVNGFNYFNPSKIKDFAFESPVQLLSVAVNGNAVSLEKFSDQKKPAKFKSDENNISIEFAAIDFNRNDNINYLYKLHHQDAWISIGNRRTLNFANLSPGKYNVEVEIQYSYNEVSPNFLKLSFTVLPPFYKTYWFIIIVCVVFILLVYSMYRYRVNEIKKYYAMRTNISQDLHDEIGSTLGSISIYSEVAKKLSVTNEKADEAISKIGVVSRELIDKMGDIVWSINPNNESFEQLQNRMQAFAAMMLTPHEIQFSFHSPGNGNSPVFSMQKRRNIYLIFKEAINNIVKYAECKTVNIDLSIRENNFCMLISDDGKGFDLFSNSVFNGNGIKNMRSRSADMHAQLIIDSVIDKGTVIKVTLKL